MDPDAFNLRIESLSYGGRGVGHRQDGKVVFVPMVIPGEIVRVKPVRDHAQYIIASALDIIEESPNRVKPLCPIFQSCGGCDWQHIQYKEQVLWKKKILNGEIEKRCPTGPDKEEDSVESDQIYGYRTHATIHCSYHPEISLGFYKKMTKEVVEFERCPILNQKIQDTIDSLKTLLGRYPIYNLISLEIHAPQDEVIVLARLKDGIHSKDLDTMNTLYKELDVAGLCFEIDGRRTGDYMMGTKYCSYEVMIQDRVMILSSGLGGFIQANMDVNDLMINHISELAAGSDHLLDLYSGSGNISIPLSISAKEVVAVDRHVRLIEQGKKNLKRNKIKNVRFITMDAAKAVKSIQKESISFDTVVLDPPREGAKEITGILPSLGASRIIYVSCNPSTLSRDLAGLMDAGYKLRHTKVFDMFPQTYHIESVSYLER